MATQAQARSRAKERVRQVKRSLKKVDTRLEIMERRLDKLLERDTLIQIDSFDSFLKNFDVFIDLIKDLERTLTNVMVVFRLMF